ncbi:MAG: hypothetical protein V4606_01160 [Patescibacteria group bacterium]
MSKLEVAKATVLATASGFSTYFTLKGFADLLQIYVFQILGLYFLIKFLLVASHGIFCLLGEKGGEEFQEYACRILKIK